jgi:hypothetical protein
VLVRTDPDQHHLEDHPVRLAPTRLRCHQQRRRRGPCRYPRSALLLTCGAYLLLNVLAGPIVEELYFRGYLLPRLSRFGRKAPLLETLLFTVYHFWQPWLYPTILVAFASVVFTAHRTRNIYVAIWATACSILVADWP